MDRFLPVGLCRTHKSRTSPLLAGFLLSGNRRESKKAPQFAVTSRPMVCFASPGPVLSPLPCPFEPCFEVPDRSCLALQRLAAQVLPRKTYYRGKELTLQVIM